MKRFEIVVIERNNEVTDDCERNNKVKEVFEVGERIRFNEIHSITINMQFGL